jgi:hypothetical protein
MRQGADRIATQRALDQAAANAGRFDGHAGVSCSSDSDFMTGQAIVVDGGACSTKNFINEYKSI